MKTFLGSLLYFVTVASNASNACAASVSENVGFEDPMTNKNDDVDDPSKTINSYTMPPNPISESVSENVEDFEGPMNNKNDNVLDDPSNSINYNPGNSGVLRVAYINLQKKCILLTDTCIQMSRDWIDDDQPHDGTFNWVAKNRCSSDDPDKWENYIFQNKTLIWTLYEQHNLTQKSTIHIEPAAFIAFEKSESDTAYLVFRGSQTGPNWGLDGQFAQVPNPLVKQDGGTVMRGFAKYFQGLGIDAEGTRPGQGKLNVPGKTLYQNLAELSKSSGVNHLIVTGHSLGSTAATLSCALASQQGWFETVVCSVSASPRVGDSDFQTWYDGLKSDRNGPTMLRDRSWRLENLSDVVPYNPGKAVGIKVFFDEKYDNHLKIRHNPCCTYSYAINHPQMTTNPEYKTCTFPETSDNSIV